MFLGNRLGYSVEGESDIRGRGEDTVGDEVMALRC